MLSGLSAPVVVDAMPIPAGLKLELAEPVGEPPAGEVIELPYTETMVTGTLGGEVSVGASGAASWSRSLTVVLGVAGMEPSLSIGYSGGGYGGLGVGFSLSAGGSISRCRSTIGQDGRHQQIQWLARDPLCLGGSRLVAVSGQHGADGTEYAVQDAPTVRVKASGVSTAADSHFAVYTPDGRVTRYGSGPDDTHGATQWARINGALVPLAWHVASVRDQASNILRYQYTGEAVEGDDVLTPADHRLAMIGYGENVLAGQPPTRKVAFDYSLVQTLLGAPNTLEGLSEGSAAVHQGYVAGKQFSRRRVLTDVRMEVLEAGQWSGVRSYSLFYEPVPQALADKNSPDRVRLTGLTQCLTPVDAIGTFLYSNCFEPTRFEWSAGAPKLESMDGFGLDGVSFYPLPPLKDLKTAAYTRPEAQVTGDFDADGDPDFLVAPACVNDESACDGATWQLWLTDPKVSASAGTNMPAWSAGMWQNRAGTVLPASGVAKVWDFEVAHDWVLPDPKPVQTGRSLDPKATPAAFAVNYDGTFGTDVLVGTLVKELAGAMMDPPWGLGMDTVTRRTPGNDAPDICSEKNENQEWASFWTLGSADQMACYAHPAKSEADYTGHPGFMSGLEIHSLVPGTTATFESTSLNYGDGRPLLWVQPLDMNGDGLTDLTFCQANVDYAAVAGNLMQMFYAEGEEAANWISGTLRYALNVPGEGIDLSNGGASVSTASVTPCHALDAYLVTDLYGDGRESLLHYVHPSVGVLTIDEKAPVVPDDTEHDPHPYNENDTKLEGYWSTLQEWNWALQLIGNDYFTAVTWQDSGMAITPTGVPFEHFMRWQQPGNSRARFSRYQASSASDPDGGWTGMGSDSNEMLTGRLTQWGDPGRPMAGMGESMIRKGDVNGDGLEDLLRVDLGDCFYGTDKLDDKERPVFKLRGCSYQDVTEYGSGLLELTHETLGVHVYLNRGDGSYALGDILTLWHTDMPSDVHLAMLHNQYTGKEYDKDKDIYHQAWAAATTGVRHWRQEFGSSLMGDGNGDGLADLGLLQMAFHPTGGWWDDTLGGVYEMTPVWYLARHSGTMSWNVTPMGISVDALVPGNGGWPGVARTIRDDSKGGHDTIWTVEGDLYPSTVTPYEQQLQGLAARLMRVDLDHNGRDELMFYDHVRGRWEIAGPAAMAQPQAELLTAVTDGLGARTELDYAPQHTLNYPDHPWTLADLTLAYPLVSRPSTAAAVMQLRNDSGQDADYAPVYTATNYLYGKSRSDIRHGVGLGIDRRMVLRSTPTPSGLVTSLRTERYDSSGAYDPVLKAYPTAGALISQTTQVLGEADEAVAITHAGYSYSGHAGIKPGTWYRRLDATTATQYEVGDDVAPEMAGKLFFCLVEAYDGAAECDLGAATSMQPLSRSLSYRDYDAYGSVTLEGTESAGSTTLTQRSYVHQDPAVLGGVEAYVLGLPGEQHQAHEPEPGAGYTVRTSQTEYDVRGWPTTVTVEPKRPQYQSSQSFTYNVYGHVASTTLSAAGHPDATTSYAYSPSGAYRTQVTDAQGHSEHTTWFEGCGVAAQVTGVLGHTQVNDIDPFCRLKGTQSYFGATALNRKTTMDYLEWEPGQPEPYPDVEVHVRTQVEGGAATHTIADRTGKVTVSQGQGLGFEVYTRTRYDVLGRVIATSLPTKVGEQPAGWTRTSYDARGRSVKVIAADDSTRTTRYAREVVEGFDRVVVEATNEIGQTGRSEVNALGQVVKVTPPEDPKLPGVDLSMRYTYGAFGTLLRAEPDVATAAKGPTVMSYDDYGRLLSSQDGQAGVRKMRYDALGRLDESEDALGQVTKMRYDVLGRVIERTQAYGTPEAKSATWSYDLASGLLSAAVNAEGTVTEEPLLDGLNRPAGLTTTIHGRPYTTRQTYDAWGRVASQTLPSLSVFPQDAVTTQTQYNDLDQVIGLAYKGQTVWAPDEADVWGHITQQRYGNGLKARSSYAPLTGRLSSAEVYRQVKQDNDLWFDEPLERFAYHWYDTGLIERRESKALNPQQSDQFDHFHYTPRGELDRWTTVGANQQVLQQVMAYDGWGNIQSSPTGAYTYTGQWLDTIKGPLGELAYKTNANGQVYERSHPGGVTQLGYDPLNRVATITEPQASLTITYSADGAKVHVKDAHSGRETTYLGGYEEERGGDLGTLVISRYALGPIHLSRQWNTKEGQFSYTDEISYLTPADHLGSSTLVTTDKGLIQDQRSYGVWGNEREPGNWAAFKAAPKAELLAPNTGYTGHHERRQFGATASGISGLVDMQSRYYDPSAGRFMAPDVIVPGVFNPIAWNRYTYVDNSPVNYYDPEGYAKEPNHEEYWSMADFIQGAMEWNDRYVAGSGIAAEAGPTGANSSATGMMNAGILSGMAAASNYRRTERMIANLRPDISNAKRMLMLRWVEHFQHVKGKLVPFHDEASFDAFLESGRDAGHARAGGDAMEGTANKAEMAQGATMGGADDAFAASVKISGIGRWLPAGWTKAGRAARAAAEAALAAKRAAAARRRLDLDGALRAGTLQVASTPLTARAVMLEGEQIGSIHVFQNKQVLVLDAKYATVGNAGAAFHLALKNAHAEKLGMPIQVAFTFGVDRAGAAAFRDQLNAQLASSGRRLNYDRAISPRGQAFIQAFGRDNGTDATGYLDYNVVLREGVD